MKRLLQILNTKTFTQSLITFSGTFINGSLGIIFYVLAARFLGPANFGILVISLTSLNLLADLANFGTNTGIIRFIGKYKDIDDQKTNKILKLSLEFRLIVWLLIIGIGWFLTPWIANNIFGKVDLLVPLRVALIGSGGAMLFAFVTNAIIAHQRFFTWSILNIASNLLRLFLIISFLSFGLTIENTLFSYIIVLFLGFFIGLIFLPNFFKTKNEKSIFQDFFKYNKWVALFTIISIISSRMDTFLVGKFLAGNQIGMYGVANQLPQVISQLTFALASVAAPKLASFGEDKIALGYLKKLQLLVFGLFILGILSLPIIVFLIPLIYGSDYIQSISPFIIIFIGQLFFLLSVPAHQAILYYFAKPRVFAIIEIIKLLLIIILGTLLIPKYQITGAAILILVINLLSFLITSIYVLINFSKKK